MARKLTIREAEVGDVTAIQQVARAGWHATYDAFLGSETVEEFLADWYAADGLRENVTGPEHVFLVAARDSEVLGFADACPSNDDPDVAILARIYVHPNHWSEGVGGTLLARVEYLLGERAFDRLRLVVFAENDVGVSFYESAGFERVKEREVDIDGETHTECVYEKVL